MMVLYKNIIQSSSTACIPELQLAFIFPITRSTSTAYEGNTESKQRLQTIVSHWTSCCTMNNSTESECSRPWHFICQAEPNFDGNYRTKVGLPDADKHTCFINNKKTKVEQEGSGAHTDKNRGVEESEVCQSVLWIVVCLESAIICGFFFLTEQKKKVHNVVPFENN